MASEIAERRGIAVAEARAMLAAVDLQATAETPTQSQADVAASAPETPDELSPQADPVENLEDHEAREHEMSYEEMVSLPEIPEPPSGADPDVRSVLERGIHDIAGEVRNSLDFHRSQDGGGEVTRVVLSGSALDLPGFADALQSHLRVEVRPQTVGLADESLMGKVSTHRLAIAAGLATTEIDR
jgi:Tfp pilus assembly PilM family ATPase